MRLSSTGDGFEDGLLLQHVRELEDAFLIGGAPDDLGAQLVHLEDVGWRDVHRAADRYREELQERVLQAFKNGHQALNRAVLVAALRKKNELLVFLQVSGAIVEVSKALRKDLPELLTQVLEASGKTAVRRLRRLLDLRAAADADFAFDVTNPEAVKWIQQHVGSMIDGLNEATREEIRDLVEAAFEEGFDVDELADRVTEVIGDAARAEVIARTETMQASNEGQLQAWDQAVEAGLLTGNEKKEWITTPDDRLCPVCEPMDGETVGLGEDFDVDGERVSTPPAHPNCRCTIALSVE
jgi:SPP1 gp7 family putative phage head morphogenesis protein